MSPDTQTAATAPQGDTGPRRAAGEPIRVFVSSTFRDFDQERDALRRVEARLRDRLRPYGTTATLVDLRWGIQTSDESERESEILRVCLDEIDRTRPFFLGLIGDRYGWVPDGRLAEEVTRDLGLSDVAGRSVTELEILHGVLASADSTSRSVFMFRTLDPAPPPQMSEAPGSDGEHKLAELRSTITDSGARVVPLTVPIRADGTHELTGFEQQAFENLWELIESELGEAPEETVALDRLQAGFRSERLDAFVGRDALVNERLDEALATRGSFQVLEADAGSGKSAIAAGIHRAARVDGVAAFFHTFSLGPQSNDAGACLRRAARHFAAANGVPVPPVDQERDELLAVVLQLASLCEPPVIWVLDALDECDHPANQALSWLPDPLPDWLRIIATTTRWPEFARDSAATHAVANLGADTTSRLMEQRLALRAKSAPAEVLRRLATRDGTPAPPLWSALAADVLAGLDLFDFAELGSLPGDAEAQLIGLITRTAAELPLDVPSLYRVLFERIGRQSDPELAEAIIVAISLSRAGLPAEDLIGTARMLLEREVGDLELARVRWSLGSQVSERGIHGELDATHNQFREAATAPLPIERRREVHRALADVLCAQDSDFAHLERTWHLLQAGRIEDVARLLATALVEHTGIDRDDPIAYDVAALAAWLEADELRTQPTVERLLGTAAEEPVVWGVIVESLPSWLEGPSANRIADDIVKVTTTALADAPTGESTWSRVRATTADLASSQAQAANDLAGAIEAGREALELWREVPQDPGAAGGFEVSTAHRRLSSLTLWQGDSATARHHSDAAIILSEQRYADTPGDSAVAIDHAESLIVSAEVSGLRGQLARSREDREEALGIYQRLASSNPDDLSLVEQRARIHLELRQTCLDLDDPDVAVHHARRAVHSFRELVRQDPSVTYWRTGLADALLRLAQLGYLADDDAEATQLAAEAHRIASALIDINPSDVDRQMTMATALVQLAQLQSSAGDHARAVELYRSAAEVTRPLVGSDRTNVDRYEQTLELEGRIGRALLKAGVTLTARQILERVHAARTALVELDPSNTDWQKDLVRADLHMAEATADAPDARFSLAHLDAAAQRAGRLMEGDPDDSSARDLWCLVQEDLIDRCESGGDLRGAITQSNAFIEQLRRFAANSEEPGRWLRRIGMRHEHAARLHDAMADDAGCVYHLDAAVSALTTAAHTDRRASLVAAVGFLTAQLGLFVLALDDVQGAFNVLTGGLAEVEPALAEFADWTEVALAVFNLHEALLCVAENARWPDNAQHHMAVAWDIANRLRSADPADDRFAEAIEMLRNRQ